MGKLQGRERLVHVIERCLRRWWKVGMGCRVGLSRSRDSAAKVTGGTEGPGPGRVPGEKDGN